MSSYYTCLVTESFSSWYKLIAAGFREHWLGTHISCGVLVRGCVPPLRGSLGFRFRRVRNSDVVRIRSPTGWFWILKEVAVVPSECKATCKVLPLGRLRHSVLSFGRRQGKRRLSRQNPQRRSDCTWCFYVEDGARSIGAGRAAWRPHASRMALSLRSMLLLPQCDAHHSAGVTRLRGMVSSLNGFFFYIPKGSGIERQ